MFVKIPVSIIKEGERLVAYSPVLDLSTSGKSYDEVKKRFTEIIDIFFEEIKKKGSIEIVLKELGWEKVRTEWQPPLIISQESELYRIPVK